MKEILLKNKRTTLIGLLIAALFVLFLMERVSVNEVVALITALNAVGFFMCKDGATKKEHIEEAKQYHNELNNDLLG